MYFKRITHLPPIPPELLTFDEKIVISLPDSGYGRRFIKDGRLLENSCVRYGLLSNHLLIDWIQGYFPRMPEENITFQLAEQGTHIVHSDVRRKYALNYIFDTGGSSAYTSWYQEKGKPLHRIKASGRKQTDDGFVDYKDLEMLSSVRIPNNTWILMASDILHDVDVIVGQRKSISISIFSEEELTKLGLS